MATCEPKPLAGKRVVVTRAAEQAGALIRELGERGAEVLLLPTVGFAEPSDLEPLDDSIDSLEGFDWLFFTSANAVRFFVRRCRARGVIGWLGSGAGPRVAAVGPATAAAAEQEGIRLEYVASVSRGAALAAQLGPRLAGKRVLLPRSDLASGDLPAVLRGAGAEVADVVAYQTLAPSAMDPRVTEAIAGGEVDVICLFSPSAFRNLVDEVGLENLRRNAGRVALAAIGPVTAGAIRESGLSVEIEADDATSQELVRAIESHFARTIRSGVHTP